MGFVICLFIRFIVLGNIKWIYFIFSYISFTPFDFLLLYLLSYIAVILLVYVFLHPFSCPPFFTPYILFHVLLLYWILKSLLTEVLVSIGSLSCEGCRSGGCLKFYPCLVLTVSYQADLTHVTNATLSESRERSEVNHFIIIPHQVSLPPLL